MSLLLNIVMIKSDYLMMMVLHYDKNSAESAVSNNHFRPRHAISHSWTVAC